MRFEQNTYVAVGADGTSLTSSHPSHWLPHRTRLPATLSGVTHGHNIFIAVGSVSQSFPLPSSRVDMILASTNGIDWRQTFARANQQLSAVTYGNGSFVTVGQSIFRSLDGDRWESVYSHEQLYLA